VFGEATASYEAGRPGYPVRLVDDVIAYAGLDGAPALEIGAGTGKATVAFAERGVAVTCLEPDARMAEVLSRKAEAFPRVTVVVSGLEHWDGLAGQFGLLIAAQSWHWVDAGKRWDLAFEALRPGGAFALFWNTNLVPEGELRDALLAVHETHDAAGAGQHTLKPAPPADFDPAGTPPSLELLADGRFTDVSFPVYHADHEFTAQRYLDYLDSLSLYRLLADDQRAALFADVHRIVEEHGGSFTVDTGTVMVRGRKRA
jgi:SAM-dependent methyltransferase